MAYTEVDMKKKVVIELDIHAYSSFGVPAENLISLVMEDLKFSIQDRLHNMEGDVGCANDCKSFGYKFKPNDFSLE